jgi:hypothetical protein
LDRARKTRQNNSAHSELLAGMTGEASRLFKAMKTNESHFYFL